MTTGDATLFADRYAPVTSRIGLTHTPLDEVAEALRRRLRMTTFPIVRASRSILVPDLGQIDSTG